MPLSSYTPILTPSSKSSDELRNRDIEKRRESHRRERRKFLDFVTKAGISAPLLKSSVLLSATLSNRMARAENTSPPKALFVYTPGGAPADTWLPDSADSMNKVSEPHKLHAPLTHFRAVNVQVNGHESSRQALGVNTSNWSSQKPTIDMRIADAVGRTTPFPLMYLGAYAHISLSRGENANLLYASLSGFPTFTAKHAIEKYFGLPQSEPNSLDAVAQAHNNALKAIKNKLGRQEQVKFESHIDAIDNFQKRINQRDSELASQAAQAAENFDSALFEGTIKDNIIDEAKTICDITLTALDIGISRVAVVQVGDNKGNFEVPSIGGGFADSNTHGGNLKIYTQGAQILQTVPAYCHDRLHEKNIDGETLFDSTAFASVSCMGDGQTHSSYGSPWLLASGLPGFKQKFSSQSNLTNEDFCGAIPVGMGIDENMFTPMGDPSKSDFLA